MKLTLLFILTAPAFALPIIPANLVVLSNFHSSADVLIVGGNGVFNGFAFNPTVTYIDDPLDPVGAFQAVMSLGTGGMLWSNPVGAEHVWATATVDYSIADGYQITRAFLYGTVGNDGSGAGASYGINAPCRTWVEGPRQCNVPPGQYSGTVSAWMNMRSDLIGAGGMMSSATVRTTMVGLTIEHHNPEPGTWVMIVGGLALIGIAKARR